MLGYYLRLALASFRRTPGLTALMVGAIGVGIGVCVVQLTLYHTISGNPIAWKSDQLYAVRLDNWNPTRPYDLRRTDIPPPQLTYRDAEMLLRTDIPKHAAIMFRALGFVAPDAAERAFEPFKIGVRVTSADFFPMFDVPFEHGGGWSESADVTPEPVIVLSRQLNARLFGGENSVGRTVRWNDQSFRVIGVLAGWEPIPKFYDITTGPFSPPELAFIPWKWTEVLELRGTGSIDCWSDAPRLTATYQDFITSECVWIQAWVELPTTAARERMQAMLDGYTDNERKSGRFKRPNNNRLTSVEPWLEEHNIVSNDNRVLYWLAFVFLAVCLINTIGLLLAKFLNGAPLSGVRRALGASRRDIFMQHIVEVSVIALAGAVTGLAVGALGLSGYRALNAMSAASSGLGFDYRGLGHLNMTSYLTAAGLAAVSALVAGLYPAWRVGRISPATYIKNQ